MNPVDATLHTGHEAIERLRIGIIGFGYWGPNLARNFDGLQDCRLVAVADRRPERLAAVREKYRDVITVTDHTQLAGLDLDAVVVATPPRTHAAVARFCLEQGWHTLVEKPLAISTEDALQIGTLAEARNRVLMVGHTFEFNPSVVQLKKLIADGELGRLYYFDMTRVNLGLYQKDLNVIWDLAPHDLSILLFLLDDEPHRVSAQGRDFITPGVYDDVHVNLEFDSGVSAHVHVSWLSPKKIRQCTIVGSKRMAVFDDVDPFDSVRVYDKGVEVPAYTDTLEDFHYSYRYGNVVTPYIAQQEPLRVQCRHFIDSILSGVRPQTDAANGARVIRIIEAAERSLLKGGSPVELSVANPILHS